jgi:hypothetical protein
VAEAGRARHMEDGVKSYVPRAGWLDRRLAFVPAVLGR